MLSHDQRRQIRNETLAGAGINALLSLGATWLTFHGQPAAWCCGASSLTLDALPHSAAVSFMATLVPSLFVLARARKGAIRGCPPIERWPGHIRRTVLTRAALFAGVGAAAGLALHGLASLAVPAEWSAGAVLGFKSAYGALVSIIATPLALRRLFAQLERTEPGYAS